MPPKRREPKERPTIATIAPTARERFTRMKNQTSTRGRLTSKTVRLFYLLSPVVFGALALLVFRLRGVGLQDILQAPRPLSEQLLVGLLAGVGSGVVLGVVIVRAPRLARLRGMIREAFDSADPTLLDLFLTALSAGFSEELLFRGALQPWLGIWLTSLLFALAHGGGIKASRGWLLFGLFVFCASVFLGVIYANFGLAASMVTHFALDLLAMLQYRWMLARTSTVHTAPV